MTVQLTLRCFPAFHAATRTFHSSGAAHTHCRICTNTSASGSPNFHPKQPPTQPKQSNSPDTRTTHSPIHIFYVLFTLPACAAQTTTDSMEKALGKPCDVTGNVRAINRSESIRENCYMAEEKMLMGGNTNTNERYECAIKEGTRNLAAHFGAFCGELKLPQNGRESVGKREREARRERERASSQRHRHSINKLTGC